jgi:hypothetical protein
VTSFPLFPATTIVLSASPSPHWTKPPRTPLISCRAPREPQEPILIIITTGAPTRRTTVTFLGRSLCVVASRSFCHLPELEPHRKLSIGATESRSSGELQWCHHQSLETTSPPPIVPPPQVPFCPFNLGPSSKNQWSTFNQVIDPMSQHRGLSPPANGPSPWDFLQKNKFWYLKSKIFYNLVPTLLINYFLDLFSLEN